MEIKLKIWRQSGPQQAGFFEAHKVEYLIVGGLAFIFHAKPRYTKDIDIWINPDPANVDKANAALAAFGAPYLVSVPVQPDEIIQLGLPPNRIDLLLSMQSLAFADAWPKRIRSRNLRSPPGRSSIGNRVGYRPSWPRG